MRDAESKAEPPPAWTSELKRIFRVYLTIVLIAFPIAMVYVFVLGGDKAVANNGTSLAYVVGVWGMLSAPWLPLASTAGWAWFQRLEHSVTIWLWWAYMIAISWELPFILFYDTIMNNRHEWWTFVWTPYAEGGDARYGGFDPTIWTLETLASLNGIVGLIALYFWYRSGRKYIRSILVFVVTASSHLYSTLQYYIVDWVSGFPSVGDDFFWDLVVKFILINSPFVIMPSCVIVWAAIKLPQLAEQTGRESPTPA